MNDDRKLAEIMKQIRSAISDAKTGRPRLSDDGLKQLADEIEDEANGLRVFFGHSPLPFAERLDSNRMLVVPNDPLPTCTCSWCEAASGIVRPMGLILCDECFKDHLKGGER